MDVDGQVGEALLTIAKAGGEVLPTDARTVDVVAAILAVVAVLGAVRPPLLERKTAGRPPCGWHGARPWPGYTKAPSRGARHSSCRSSGGST